MKVVFGLFVLLCVNSVWAKEVPQRLQGKIYDLYCGDLKEFKSGKTGHEQSDAVKSKPIGGRCVFFITTGAGESYGLISSYNSWVREFVPSGESHSIVLGRKASFSSCDVVKSGKEKEMKQGQWPKGVKYGECYPTYTKLEIPRDEMLMPSQVNGIYKNKRGDRAEVTTRIIVEGTLFDPPVYSVDVEYDKAGDKYSEIYISFHSDHMYWYNSKKRPYFQVGYSDDCDDPDCYNTDGFAKFLKNKNGSYTLNLDFEHYNNAPVEDGDEFDFEESTFLKKVAE